MSDVNEIAKATQKASEFGMKSLDLAGKVGGFFTRVFKEPINELSGMLMDKLKFVRWKRLVNMSDEIKEIHTSRGIDVNNTLPVPPKFALPLLEYASLEEDPDLQQLWNHLLANAMDPSFLGNMHSCFIEIIKGISASDARFLKTFYNAIKNDGKINPLEKVNQFFLTKAQLLRLMGMSDVDYQLSAYNLMRVQCVAPAVLKSEGLKVGTEPPTIFKGIDAIILTPLGVRFVEACTSNTKT